MVKPPWSEEQQRQVFALLRLVGFMRQQQRRWFKDHERGALIRAKKAESDVDAVLDSMRESLWDSPVEELSS